MPHARGAGISFEKIICTFFQMDLKNSKVIKCVRRALMNISKVVLSDDIGILKYGLRFSFALSTTQSELNNSLMIGDSWENDIVGAAGVGMHQVFYNLSVVSTCLLLLPIRLLI